MNRKQLRTLSEIRLREAQALFRTKHFSGAYYLAGYGVECALKACIAKQFKRYEFPDKKRVDDSYTHNLKTLAKLGNLNQAMLAKASGDPGFQANWDLVTLWSEKSRYETADRTKAKSLLDAIMDTESGVMPWITQHW